MQCPACKTENAPGAMFCQQCGASLGAAAPPPAPGFTPVAGYTQAPSGAAPGAYVTTQSGLSDNAAAAIAYLTFVPAIIFLVLDPYSRRPFVRFHAFQCIFLTVASVALHFAVTLLLFALHGFAFILSSLISLVFFILWLICIVSAAQGKWYKAPVIGDYAEQQARR